MFVEYLLCEKHYDMQAVKYKGKTALLQDYISFTFRCMIESARIQNTKLISTDNRRKPQLLAGVETFMKM